MNLAQFLQVSALAFSILAIFTCIYTLVRLGTWKLKLKEVEADVAFIEGKQGDLLDRFNRFQNKESMRAARDAKGVDKNLEQQALDLLAQKPTETQGPAQTKAALRQRLRGVK